MFQRLEKKELIESYYGSESRGGKRKYYSITTLGKAYLKETVKEWQETKEIINLFRLFSQTLLLLEGEKANCHCFHVDIAYYF